MHIVVQKAGRIQNKSYLSFRGGKVSCFLEGRLTQKIYRRRADPAEADHMPEILAACNRSTKALPIPPLALNTTAIPPSGKSVSELWNIGTVSAQISIEANQEVLRDNHKPSSYELSLQTGSLQELVSDTLFRRIGGQV